MTDWEMKVHNFMCLNKFVKKGEIVFTGSSLCELFPINEMLQNVEPRIRVYNRGIGGDVSFCTGCFGHGRRDGAAVRIRSTGRRGASRRIVRRDLHAGARGHWRVRAVCGF